MPSPSEDLASFTSATGRSVTRTACLRAGFVALPLSRTWAPRTDPNLAQDSLDLIEVHMNSETSR